MRNGQRLEGQMILLIPARGRTVHVVTRPGRIQQTDIIRHKRLLYRFAAEVNGEWLFKQIFAVEIQGREET